MPIYEYRCESCGYQLELIQKMDSIAPSGCPECGKESLKRAISAPAFRLKGSGWYETDFKSGQKRNLHDSGNKESKNSGSDVSSAN